MKYEHKEFARKVAIVVVAVILTVGLSVFLAYAFDLELKY